MAQPATKLANLARQVVEQEARSLGDPAALAAVESACRRLKNHLIDLLGFGGVSALMRRALHLAQREQPLLAGVTVSGESDACFIGLAESVGSSTEEEARAAAIAVLTHILDLLVTLLGEDLGTKPIRKLWPQASSVREIDK